jgi:CRP-like cAMP-binding protein
VSAEELRQLELFCRQFKLRSYKKGQILLGEDDEPDAIFCLLKGYIREFYLYESGNELTVYLLYPTSFFPTSLVLGEKLNSFCYEALTNCSVVKIPKSKMENFLKNKPKLMERFMRKLLREYAENLDRLEELVFGNAYQKVASVILYLANHCGEKSRKLIIVPIKITHQDIATLAGVTRETASLAMEKLKNKKVIYYSGSIITIKNLRDLRKEF